MACKVLILCQYEHRTETTRITKPTHDTNGNKQFTH